MSTKRERLYECVFRSGDLQQIAYVTAWTAEVAEQEFRESLVLGGVFAPGKIFVRDCIGKVAIETRYEPDLLATDV
ncbi:MAG TPA: hypothetical protein VMS64_10075 [Candidatus Methylomirabilis sp.]|nr:hypothetical protein [Candidatus Methylomirabilis sp.]